MLSFLKFTIVIIVASLLLYLLFRPHHTRLVSPYKMKKGKYKRDITHIGPKSFYPDTRYDDVTRYNKNFRDKNNKENFK